MAYKPVYSDQNMNIRNQIKKILNQDSPIALAIDPSTKAVDLQKMSDDKWNRLNRSKKRKIRFLVSKRNEKTLHKIDDKDLPTILENISKKLKINTKPEEKPEEKS